MKLVGGLVSMRAKAGHCLLQTYQPDELLGRVERAKHTWHVLESLAKDGP